MTKLRNLLVLAATFAVVVGIGLGLTHVALAADPLADICANNAQSETCQSQSSTTNPLTGKNGTLYKVSAVLSTAAGITAIIVIIISGLRYMTSGGEAQKAASAKNTLIGAIIGLVIIVLAQTIITFVVRKL